MTCKHQYLFDLFKCKDKSCLVELVAVLYLKQNNQLILNKHFYLLSRT